MVLKEVGVYGFPNFVVFLTQINTIDCCKEWVFVPNGDTGFLPVLIQQAFLKDVQV